jgi:hypothetical protein
MMTLPLEMIFLFEISIEKQMVCPVLPMESRFRLAKNDGQCLDENGAIF